MRSASHRAARRSLAALACGALLAVPAAGCSTTQDTAAAKKAESKRILERRAQKRAARKHGETKGGEER